MSLVARDLSVAPPGAPDPAVRGFSLALARGEWVALTGPNGCGKTSVALALAGLWPALSGAVLLDGAPIADARRHGGIAVVLQDPSSQLLQPTVADEIAFTARNLDRPDREIEEDLRRWSARLGLAGELERDPHALSAGRQQLVLLAAALVSRPRFLIADEAASHLDPDGRSRVLDAIAGEAGAGLGVLWVSQSGEEIARADRSVRLGPDPVGPDPESAPRSAEGSEVALVVEVSRWDGGPGPRVHCHRALRVEVIARGVTGLIGSNGAGKSVLLAAVAGQLDLPQIRMDRVPGPPPPLLAAQYPEREIFEERVEDEVTFAAVSRGLGREEAISRAASAFGTLGLGGAAFLERRTWDLSAGEKRLLQAVGVLIAPASLRLLDEPTAGLDGGRRLALGSLVRARAGEAPVIVASQDRGWLRAVGASLQVVGEALVGSGKSQQKNGLTEPCPKV